MNANPKPRPVLNGETITVPRPVAQISGTGEMADLVRSFDWHGTSLGPIDTWPESLLCSVNIMLSCRFPTFVFWGPDHIQFYNDATLSFIAEKHPVALGCSAYECWKEAWSVIGLKLDNAYLYGKPTSQEKALVPTIRGGRLQDAYWNCSYSPIHEPNGDIGGVFVICNDVTGEVLAQQEYDSVSQRLSQALEATTDAVAIVDRDWRFTFLNRKAMEMADVIGNPLGRNLFEVLPKLVYEDSPYVEHLHRAMFEGISGEFEAFYPDPFNIWLHVKVRPSKEGVVFFFNDFTTRKRLTEAAQENAARRDAMYNTTLEYIGLLSTDGTLLDCNRAALEFAGNRREDVVGLYFWDTPWFTYTPGAPQLIREAIASAAAGEYIHYELPLTRPSGETLIFDFSLCPVRDSSGQVVLLVPEGRDITHIKQAEAALKETEKLAAVGRLSASIAHEINNPLESVTNLLYLALQSLDLDEAHGFLRIAEQELRRVSIISSQTLRFFRQTTSPATVQCDSLIDGVLAMQEGRILNSRIHVHKRLVAWSPITCFDGEIRQALNNLIGNAIDAMRSTGGSLFVRSRDATDWATGRKGLVLTVADTGPGIRPENIGRIFEPFYSTKGAGGTGLGLWVTSEIVERHKGKLRVRSSSRPPHTGTVFTLFLPFNGLTP